MAIELVMCQYINDGVCWEVLTNPLDSSPSHVNVASQDNGIRSGCWRVDISELQVNQ
jgi:hypothetical protein